MRVIGRNYSTTKMKGDESDSEKYFQIPFHSTGNPRDPITKRQRMIRMSNHLRKARYLGSMKPFSEGDWIPKGKKT